MNVYKMAKIFVIPMVMLVFITMPDGIMKAAVLSTKDSGMSAKNTVVDLAKLLRMGL